MRIVFNSISLLTILLFGSCSKDFLNINENPNSLPVASPNFVFANALKTTGSNEVFQNETGSYFAGQWTQSSSYILNTSIFSFQFTNADLNYFDPIYNNLEDYQYVLENAGKSNQPFLTGPANVMKAYLFQRLVDMYGNVPFSEALKGATNFTPKYDDQQAIYLALIPLLDTAISNLAKYSFPGAYMSSDIVFSGNTAKWTRFANTLKLRILVRQSRLPGKETYIAGEIKKIIDQGYGFLNPGEDVGVNPGYILSDGKLNPFYERFGYNASGSAQSYSRYPRPTTFLFDVLKASNDTVRLKRIAYAKGGEDPNKPGFSLAEEIVSNYIGVPFGANTGYPANTTSYIGPAAIVKGLFNRPLYIFLNAEAQFLLAEAAYRYGTAAGLSGSAQEYFELGVKESFRVVGVADANNRAITLLTSGKPGADYTTSPDKLQAIWQQKWLALTNFSGIESWIELRRTNYPNVPVSISVAPGQETPVRLYYPASEAGSNGANVKAQGLIDVFSTKIFWDVD